MWRNSKRKSRLLGTSRCIPRELKWNFQRCVVDRRVFEQVGVDHDYTVVVYPARLGTDSQDKPSVSTQPEPYWLAFL